MSDAATPTSQSPGSPPPTPPAMPSSPPKIAPRRTAPPVLDYFALLRPAQRHLVETFLSRENWINFLKSLPWVVPLTVLIWVYAEREQLADEPKVTFPIEVRTSDPNRVVTLVSPREKIIMAQLTGPRANLDK